jgi:hypothetical protein
MGKRVRYPNGFIGFASDKAAAVLEKRDGYKILGEATEAPEREEKKTNRKALIGEALKLNLGTKAELEKMSDSDLVGLVGEEK